MWMFAIPKEYAIIFSNWIIHSNQLYAIKINVYNTHLIYKKIYKKIKIAKLWKIKEIKINAKMKLGLFSFKIQKTNNNTRQGSTFCSFLYYLMDLSFARLITPQWQEMQHAPDFTWMEKIWGQNVR